MPTKVTLNVTKGEAAGKTFTTTENTRVLVGRQDDCNLVVPEKTVSRYHCMLEIEPPKVRVQDFGSLNGTYLNGEKIGQRDRNQTWEQAREGQHDVFSLKDGDRLGLGQACEIQCSIEIPPTCAECGKELTAEDGSLKNDAGKRICKACHEALEAERKRREQEEMLRTVSEETSAAEENGEKKCTGCGKTFRPTAPDNNLCKSCLADQAKVLSGILAMLNIDAQKKDDRPGTAGAAIVEGYDMVKLLGKGGMGEVWRVRERKSGKDFALKTMLPEVAMDDDAKALFLREAHICECLRHRNVVQAYQTGCANGTLYILMDLCEGGSVDDLMRKNGGKLSLEMATWITLQALSGLDYVHNMDIDVEIKGRRGATETVHVNGVVHRDFKPGNIFLADKSDHPIAKVADFGMAKAFEAAGKSGVSADGSVKGTQVFMAREQAKNCKYSKPDVDVWAAAASYYYMVTGQFPRNFRRGENFWLTIITRDAVPIRDRDASVPRGIAEVVDRALTERPRIGYSTAAEFRRDLVAALPERVRDFCKDVL